MAVLVDITVGRLLWSKQVKMGYLVWFDMAFRGGVLLHEMDAAKARLRGRLLFSEGNQGHTLYL
jgi:hypothetical protein